MSLSDRDMKSLLYRNPTKNAVKNALSYLGDAIGSTFKSHRESALSFLEGRAEESKRTRTPIQRGPLYQFLSSAGCKNLFIGHNFISWQITVLFVFRKTLRTKLPPNLVSFQDNAWLHPQIYGQEPPPRPNFNANMNKWNLAKILCADRLETMKRNKRPNATV